MLNDGISQNAGFRNNLGLLVTTLFVLKTDRVSSRLLKEQPLLGRRHETKYPDSINRFAVHSGDLFSLSDTA
jgi:hypothetical protein